MHVAAASGLEHCVQALINAGSPLFTENNDKMTPCDMAVKHGHHAIAQLLESKMVFVSLKITKFFSYSFIFRSERMHFFYFEG